MNSPLDNPSPLRGDWTGIDPIHGEGESVVDSTCDDGLGRFIKKHTFDLTRG